MHQERRDAVGGEHPNALHALGRISAAWNVRFHPAAVAEWGRALERFGRMDIDAAIDRMITDGDDAPKLPRLLAALKSRVQRAEPVERARCELCDGCGFVDGPTEYRDCGPMCARREQHGPGRHPYPTQAPCQCQRRGR